MTAGGRSVLAGCAVMIGIAGYLAFRLGSADARVFLPGETTHGHYQIELACQECHVEALSSRALLQESCERCHAAELKAADDSHPKRKFTDPRNADRVAVLDARECVTCHREHVPEQTLSMGLTLPGDYCFRCHESVGSERPTHEGLAFDSCASAGCHNFHDNRGLYEDFLAARALEPWIKAEAALPEREPSLRFADHALPALGAGQADAPAHVAGRAGHVADWLASTHAGAGVNCSGCHAADSAWSDRPGVAGCRGCHADEVEAFLASRHGMRLAIGLDPMRPELARHPMRPEAVGIELGCTSCHAAHAFDPEPARVEACLGCHADEHSLAYRDSPHAALDARGQEMVTCATCHLPRLAVGKTPVRVQHNQNANLRPNEKMIRSVCLPCHGVAFTIDALADAELVRRNFHGRPSRHVESVDWAHGRVAGNEGERR